MPPRKRTWPRYYNAAESAQPGYLAHRFRAYRRLQRLKVKRAAAAAGSFSPCGEVDSASNNVTPLKKSQRGTE